MSFVGAWGRKCTSVFRWLQLLGRTGHHPLGGECLGQQVHAALLTPAVLPENSLSPSPGKSYVALEFCSSGFSSQQTPGMSVQEPAGSSGYILRDPEKPSSWLPRSLSRVLPDTPGCFWKQWPGKGFEGVGFFVFVLF